jgi:hypothetical protein
MATRMKKACGSSMRTSSHVQEVAVVQGLQAQVVELQVALGLQRGAQRARSYCSSFSSSSSASTPFLKPGKYSA